MITLEIIVPGRAKDVVAMVKGGRTLCAGYLRSLNKKTRAKLFALMEVMAQRGTIRNTQKFRHLRDGIYEFKTGAARVFCFLYKDMVVCTHGKNKPKPRQLEAAIDKAKNLRREFSDEGR